MPELVPGIGLGDRLAPRRHQIAREHRHRARVDGRAQHVDMIGAEVTLADLEDLLERGEGLVRPTQLVEHPAAVLYSGPRPAGQLFHCASLIWIEFCASTLFDTSTS